MSGRKPYIEDKLFYRFFQAAYRYLTLNLYFTLFNVFFFLLCTFTVFRGDTLFLFFLSTLTIGPSLMALLDEIREYKEKADSPSFRSYAKRVLRVIRPGIVFSVLLAANFAWFLIVLYFLEHHSYGFLMLPFFFTLGSVTLATIINAMVAMVKGLFTRITVALKAAFFLSIRSLFVSYYHSVLMLILLFAMYYRSIFGFLVLASMLITYLYHLSEGIVLKKNRRRENT